MPSRYGTPPFDVSHSGGVFTTRLLARESDEAAALLPLNARLLASLGLVRGVSHSEYIRGHDGRLVFLETSARVGGAHIAELVEAATGVNMWAEWAKVEVAGGKAPYAVAADAPRLRRAARLAGAAGIARPRRLHRSRSRLAAAKAASRRADRAVAEPRAGGRAAGVATRERFRQDFVAALPARETPFD